jgi:uncharacterized protein (TIGR02270 family)
MPPLGRPPVMLDIVEEHFEELDFLWELRESVIFAPDWNLEELAELEERAEAHLDGLRLAGAHAVDVARPHLKGEFKSGATAATFVFMETGEPDLAKEVLDALATAEPPARDGIRVGLRHSRIDAIEPQLRALSESAPPAVRAAAADVLAFHRRPIPDLKEVLLEDGDELHALVFGALGRGESPLEVPVFEFGLRSQSPVVRRAALEAAARSGMPGLEALCRAAAMRADDPDPEALAFLGVLGRPEYLPILLGALAKPELAIGAIRGLGALGHVEAIPPLIEAMKNPAMAHAAGAAFKRITGATDIAGPRPPVRLAASDAIEDEFVDDTPPPDAERARAWWERGAGAFATTGPWQAGIAQSPGGPAPNAGALSLEQLHSTHLRACADSATPPIDDVEARHVRIRQADPHRAPSR